MKVTLSFDEWKQHALEDIDKLRELASDYLYQVHSRAIYIVSDPMQAFIEHMIEHDIETLYAWLDGSEDWNEYLLGVYQTAGDREHDAN